MAGDKKGAPVIMYCITLIDSFRALGDILRKMRTWTDVTQKANLKQKKQRIRKSILYSGPAKSQRSNTY